jgi:hypothetical protein
MDRSAHRAASVTSVRPDRRRALMARLRRAVMTLDPDRVLTWNLSSGYRLSRSQCKDSIALAADEPGQAGQVGAGSGQAGDAERGDVSQRVGAGNDVIAADLGLRCHGRGHKVGHLAARSRRIGLYRRSCQYESLIWRCSACSAGSPFSLAPSGLKMPRSCSFVIRLPPSSARSSRRSCRGPTGRSCLRWPGCCQVAASGSCA